MKCKAFENEPEHLLTLPLARNRLQAIGKAGLPQKAMALFIPTPRCPNTAPDFQAQPMLAFL